MKREIEALLGLIQESPTAFQAVAALKRRLLAAGYTELREAEPWTLCRSGKYCTTRNGSPRARRTASRLLRVTEILLLLKSKRIRIWKSKDTMSN